MSTVTPPAQMPYYSYSDSTLNCMQNQALASDIFAVSKDVAGATSSITGTIQNLNLSARDSTDRNQHALQQQLSGSSQVIQTGIERTAATTQSAVERTAGNVQTSIGVLSASGERLAGENRITTLQTNADMREQTSDQTRDILNAINTGAFETRLSLVTNFSAVALEQQKSKESLSHQLSENKYEDLKNQNVLVMQLCDLKSNQIALAADVKYDALKNYAELSSRIDRSTCDLKTTILSVDENRIRDDLNRARIVNELSSRYSGGYGGFNGYNGGFGGLGGGVGSGIGGSVSNGFGFTMGEILASKLTGAPIP